MKAKRWIASVMLCCLLLWCGAAMGEGERVYDNANLFSASEKAEILNAVADFQKSTGYDFVVLTSSAAHGDASQQTIADEFYDRGGFGLDSEKSGVLYYIDMYDRQEYISTAGTMIDVMTDDRIEEALDQSNPHLRTADYAGGALAMISAVKQFAKAGIPEGAYRYDLITGERLTARHKALTSTEMLVSALIAAVVALIAIAGVKRTYQLKGHTYSYEYRENSDVEITDREDAYLRTTTTQTRKAEPPEDRGGMGGGNGGGSAVHTSSGGTSHGGGGRGF